MDKVGIVSAIKEYFERNDFISPGGGKKVDMQAFKGLSTQERREMAAACAKELGKELDG